MQNGNKKFICGKFLALTLSLAILISAMPITIIAEFSLGEHDYIFEETEFIWNLEDDTAEDGVFFNVDNFALNSMSFDPLMETIPGDVNTHPHGVVAVRGVVPFVYVAHHLAPMPEQTAVIRNIGNRPVEYITPSTNPGRTGLSRPFVGPLLPGEETVIYVYTSSSSPGWPHRTVDFFAQPGNARFVPGFRSSGFSASGLPISPFGNLDFGVLAWTPTVNKEVVMHYAANNGLDSSNTTWYTVGIAGPLAPFLERDGYSVDVPNLPAPYHFTEAWRLVGMPLPGTYTGGSGAQGRHTGPGTSIRNDVWVNLTILDWFPNPTPPTLSSIDIDAGTIILNEGPAFYDNFYAERTHARREWAIYSINDVQQPLVWQTSRTFTNLDLESGNTYRFVYRTALISAAGAVVTNAGVVAHTVNANVVSDPSESFPAALTHTLTGIVSSFNELHETRLYLYPIDDSGAKGTPIETTIPAQNRSTLMRVEQSFNFAEVPAGNYTLVARKPAHTTFTVTGVAVDDDLDISALLEAEGIVNGVMFLHAGDIKGSGFIGLEDVAMIRNMEFYGRRVDSFPFGSDERRLAGILNISGSGFIGLIDLAIARAAENYRRGDITIDLKGQI